MLLNVREASVMMLHGTDTEGKKGSKEATSERLQRIWVGLVLQVKVGGPEGREDKRTKTQ